MAHQNPLYAHHPHPHTETERCRHRPFFVEIGTLESPTRLTISRRIQRHYLILIFFPTKGIKILDFFLLQKKIIDFLNKIKENDFFFFFNKDHYFFPWFKNNNLNQDQIFYFCTTLLCLPLQSYIND